MKLGSALRNGCLELYITPETSEEKDDLYHFATSNNPVETTWHNNPDYKNPMLTIRKEF